MTALAAALGAERAILGAALVDPAIAEQAVALLAPSDFEDARHRVIAAAMGRLCDCRTSIDAVTVRGELERSGQLGAAGGVQYIAGLMDGLPRVSSIEAWARSVREQSRLRALRSELDRLRDRLEEGDATPDEILAELDRLAVPGSLGGGILDRDEVGRRTWELVDAEIGGRAIGIGTGLSSLDSRLRFRGWRPGQLVYVGARTSRGKSALLVQFAEAAAAASHRALVFSLEMTPEEVGARRLIAEAGVGLRSLYAWSQAERDRTIEKLTKVAHILKRPFDFASPSVRTLGAIRAECIRAKAQGGLGLVVVDYLGLVRQHANRDDRSLYERTTAVSQGLKLLAIDLEVPVLAAVQLNREATGGRDRRERAPRPTLATFRDSGAIEQDCDIALLIHQDQTSDVIQDGPVELLVAKQRNGWTGTIKLRWNGTCARFEEPQLEDHES